MARENEQLIIAYFQTREEAEAAAKELKEWDKEYEGIELGAMGVVSVNEKGEVKTEKIGSRATGTGAKWGTLVGAVAGILTGGAALVPGALAGLALGSVAGSLVHRALGMTDEEKQNLETHLREGGVALAVMAHHDEAAAVESVLSALCDEVTSCVLDQQTLDHLQSSAAQGDV